MTPEKWEQVGKLYQAALELRPEDRWAFLQQACAEDRELRDELESLLAADTGAADFLAAGAMQDAAKMLAGEQPGRLAGQSFGHYQVLSLVGAGGMGEVYCARDTHLERQVALKVLPARFTQDPERLQRFVREARAASALNHPNIITIYEIGEVGETHFIATEFIEGQTLRDRLAGGRLELHAALAAAIQIAAALEAAHRAGIVHRDIKPENVMVRPDGLIKVLDFGLAKLIERSSPDADPQAPTVPDVSTRTGMVMGTPRYMSPEQARGLKVDARTDIFSLGTVTYEMIAGRVPFPGVSGDVIAAILRDELPPLDCDVPAAPGELGRVLGKALRKDREERYQTADELSHDLKHLQDKLLIAVRVGEMAASADDSLSKRVRSDAPDVRTERPEAAADVARGTASPGVLKTNVGLIALACLLAAGLGVAGLVMMRARSKRVTTSPTPSVASIKTIAVLPFKALVAESRDESIEMGMCDALIRRLSGISRLVVRPTSSVVVYNKPGQDSLAIGRELGVDALLDGYVQRSGDRIRVTAQLLRVTDGKHLWSGQFDEYFTNIFAVEDSMSGQMVEALSLELTGEEQRRVSKHYTENAEAYTLYLQGSYFLNKKTADGLKKSIERFQQAIQQDPNYGLAWAGLAESYSGLPLRANTVPKESFQAAKAAAMRALEIDDTIAEAHASLANIKYSYDWDWSGAESEFKRALELNANYLLARQSYASYLISTGRHEQAISESRRAKALDPLSLFGDVQLSRILYFAGRYDEAAGECLKALEMDPNYGVARLFLGKAYRQKGMYKEALAELEKAKDLLANDSEAMSQIGHTYAVWGHRVEAHRVLEELQESAKRSYVSPYHIAMVYAGLGQRDKTFEWLEMAYDRREARMNILKYAPEFGGLHSDTRFADLIRRIGFPGDR